MFEASGDIRVQGTSGFRAFKGGFQVQAVRLGVRWGLIKITGPFGVCIIVNSL